MSARKERVALDPERQAEDLDARTVALFERLSELVRMSTWNAGAGKGLSPLQVQLLTYLVLHEGGEVTAVQLARHFHLSKVTVGQALRSLEGNGLLCMEASARDARAKAIVLTAAGRRMARTCAGYLDVLLPLLQGMPAAQRSTLHIALYGLLSAAQEAGLVVADRMCASCSHYGSRRGRPYCELLGKTLMPEEHRVDCPEHEPMAS